MAAEQIRPLNDMELPLGAERLDAEEGAMREFLDELLRMARLSRNEVDQRLGLARGETGRILRGQRRLTYRHIFMLAGVAGLAPEELIGRFYRLRFERSQSAGPVRRSELTPSPDVAPAVVVVDFAGLRQLITEAVEEAFDRRDGR